MAHAGAHDTGHGHDPQASARIGPNAVIRLAEVLKPRSDGLAERVFAAAGLSSYLSKLPTEMVEEDEVRRLHVALREMVAPDDASVLARSAGERTAVYLLQNRIPAFAQTIIRALPPRLGSRVLATAIARNAWTFVGSGSFKATHADVVTFEVHDCPLCRGARSATPVCDFYAGTFAKLYGVLIHPQVTVRETECIAGGGSACRFEIAWPSRRGARLAPAARTS